MIIDGLKMSNPLKNYDPENWLEVGVIDTTVTGIDPYAPDWVEQAAEKVNAVEGDAYVKLNRGLLTVDQIDALLDSIPLEFSYIDQNNQFLYYNKGKEVSEMVASSNPESVGQPLGSLHPEQITNYAKMIVQQLRADDTDVVRIGHPAAGGEKFLVHSYQRIQDEEKNYMGVNEHAVDLKPIINWYLKQTKQKLVADEEAESQSAPAMMMDGVSSATKKPENIEADAISSATNKDIKDDTDAVSSASKRPF